MVYTIFIVCRYYVRIFSWCFGHKTIIFLFSSFFRQRFCFVCLARSGVNLMWMKYMYARVLSIHNCAKQECKKRQFGGQANWSRTIALDEDSLNRYMFSMWSSKHFFSIFQKKANWTLFFVVWSRCESHIIICLLNRSNTL